MYFIEFVFLSVFVLLFLLSKTILRFLNYNDQRKTNFKFYFSIFNCYQTLWRPLSFSDYINQKISHALRPMLCLLWIHYMMMIPAKRKYVNNLWLRTFDLKLLLLYIGTLLHTKLTSKFPSRIIRQVSNTCEYSKYLSVSLRCS